MGFTFLLLNRLKGRFLGNYEFFKDGKDSFLVQKNGTITGSLK